MKFLSILIDDCQNPVNSDFNLFILYIGMLYSMQLVRTHWSENAIDSRVCIVSPSNSRVELEACLSASISFNKPQRSTSCQKITATKKERKMGKKTKSVTRLKTLSITAVMVFCALFGGSELKVQTNVF